MSPPTHKQDFSLPRRIERAYRSAIHRIVGRVLAPKLPEQSFEDWLTTIARRSQAQDVREASELLAKQMVSAADSSNQKTWRAAAAKWGRGRQLHKLLQAELQGTPLGARVNTLIRGNANYISSIPLEAAQTLVNEVTKAQQSGARASTISKMTRTRFPALLRSRVNLIARTEVAKASTALTQARSEQVGADWYEWITSGDVRVRTSHKRMNGILVNWSHPPSPEALVGEPSTLGDYHAGACPNCRCTSAPMLDLDDVSWPHKVYSNGAVKSMTRAQFERQFIRKAA
jgi:SPP1 gp7 family putative phage head morphogenesis protein